MKNFKSISSNSPHQSSFANPNPIWLPLGSCDENPADLQASSPLRRPTVTLLHPTAGLPGT